MPRLSHRRRRTLREARHWPNIAPPTLPLTPQGIGLRVHTATGNWKFGLVLSLITTIMWGLLPVAMILLLREMDVYTVTWYRFASSALALGAYQAFRGRLPSLAPLRSAYGWLMLIAIVGICGNYLLYVIGLELTSPSSAQVVIQLAPLLVIIGGILLFREQMNRTQLFGILAVFIGLLLFFNQRLPELFSPGGTNGTGVLIIVLAAILWAGYALAQKQLLKVYSSPGVMLLLYVFATLIFLLPAQISSVLGLSGLGWAMLAFCSANTLIAYGCFAEALNQWQASRVSAILAMAPLVTLFSMSILGWLAPKIAPSDHIDAFALLGAIVVVTGSAACATGGMKRKPRTS
jgi:drug/metabolite transporter (DMT)-like permease